MVVKQLMARFPDVDSIHALQRLGISHVLASPEWVTSAQAKSLEEWKSNVVPELITSEMTVYRIVAVPPSQDGTRGN